MFESTKMVLAAVGLTEYLVNLVSLRDLAQHLIDIGRGEGVGHGFFEDGQLSFGTLARLLAPSLAQRLPYPLGHRHALLASEGADFVELFFV